MNNTHISRIQAEIAPLRNQIVQHPVYARIKTLEHLRCFMQHHVYAVWDFMSLLKALQNVLTCTQVPWFPVGDAETRFLINEIVVGEESDVDMNGERKSHFEMYLQAMQKSGADILPVTGLMEHVQKQNNIMAAIGQAPIPEAARSFLHFTFDLIASGKTHVLAAVFTFGREDLIPGMFHTLVNDLNRVFPDEIAEFKYYLDRHIEVDGDHHSHLALKMTALLCGENTVFWDEALASVRQALHMRIQLWDAVLHQVSTL